MLKRSQIINTIIEKYNYNSPLYLEIGVWGGETLKHVNSKNRDGVDPEHYCKSDYVNFKMTSDNFFKNHCTKKYDIIFIDGLHTAYQVTKDIYNSINNLASEGVIILDDVYPHTEYEQEALDLNKVGPQTGDVWKAVHHVWDTLVDISQDILFYKNSERGNLVFKIKKDNTSNIVIDPTIPTVNEDGWYTGHDKEWCKYTYRDHFPTYLQNIMKYCV